MNGQASIRNIGIFAHVDAGKTTLTERLLAHGGAIREAGAVDSGTAHTDRMDIERRRGISIRATCASLEWKGVAVEIIDTPGHADFIAEVERSLWALDGAVLLLSAVDGVQPQAEVLFQAIRRCGLPALIFINKADREGADVPGAIAQAREALSEKIVDIDDDEQLHLLLAEDDEAALDAYLQGNLYPRERLLPAVRALTLAGKAYPAWHGSALRDEGIAPLLDAIVAYLPPPSGEAASPLSGVVFAIDNDKALGRAAHVRLFSGTLSNRDPVALPGGQGKVSQIRTVPLEGRGRDLGTLRAGEIGAVYGLPGVRVGQVLGDAALLPRRVASGEIGAPLLMVKVTPGDPSKQNELRLALETLSSEDPLLSVETLGGELHIRVMGAVQLEVIAELLAARFGLEASLGAPNVIYRETIARPAVGFYAYTMPKPCWAVIKFEISPLPRGSGVRFESVVPAREILPRYQHQIEQAIPLAVKQGMLGWQVDDVLIQLVGGEHHLIHTHPLDFILATPIAFMDGLRRGGSVLLEPILDMRITAPEGCMGKLLGEIVRMRGETVTSQLRGNTMHVSAKTPLAAAVDFSVRLAAITGGQGTLSVRLAGYEACDLELGATCPRQGVHPLDTAKYILAARNALDGGVWDEA